MQNQNIQSVLWKWTNYWNGWQPRWFVLDKNMLSYYKSQDEVSLGCKGSVNIAAAIVTAHKTDPYRLDVVVPGEQHFYLKAGSPHERQNWLVALGSVKSSVNSEKAYKALDEIGRLTQKQCEVRLYCDSLMQQIHSVRCLVSETAPPDVQKLDECSSLLSETCDAFIKALEECVRLSAPSSPLNITGLTTTTTISPILSNGANTGEYASRKQHSRKSAHFHSRDSNSSNGESELENGIKSCERFARNEIPTFFSRLIISSGVANFQTDSATSINFQDFLKLSDNLIEIFDLLHPNAFAPVKLEFNMHITRLRRKFEAFNEANKNKGSSYTIPDILDQIFREETKNNFFANNPNSTVIALIGLKRGLDFIREFLQLLHNQLSKVGAIFDQNAPDLGEILTTAYGKTLKQHHKWVARGVFTLAAKETISFTTFYESLFLNKSHSDEADDQIYLDEKYCEKLSTDLSAVLNRLKGILTSLDKNLAKFNVLEEKD